MKRDYEWVERLDDGTKRTVRVGLPGGKISWMCRTRGDEGWDRKMTPTADQWEFLEKKVRDRYNRRHATLKDVELVVAMRPRDA